MDTRTHTLFLDVSTSVYRALGKEARALGVPLDRLASRVIDVYAAELRRGRLVETSIRGGSPTQEGPEAEDDSEAPP